ncbi:MAG: PAS domain S-box protein [Pseudomonadales bacterium]
MFGVGWIVGGFFISDLLYTQRETSLFELFKGLVFVAITAILVSVLLSMRSNEVSKSVAVAEYISNLDRWQEMRRRFYWALPTAVVIVTLAICLATYLTLTLVRKQTLQQEEQGAKTLVYSVAAQINASLKTVDLILHEAVENRRQNVNVPESELRRLQRLADDYVRDIWLIGENGIILETSDTGNIGTDSSDRAYFIHHATNGNTGLFIGSSILSRATGSHFVSASRAIRDSDGKFLGVACAALDQAKFADFWQLPADHGMVGVSLLNKENDILLSNSGSHRLTENTISSLALTTDKPSITRAENTKGELSLVAAVHLESFPGFKVIVEIPLEGRIEAFQAIVNASLFGYFGVSLLLFGILYLLGRQYRASESLEKEVTMLASFPMNNINPVLRLSPEGNYTFLNPSAVRLLDSLKASPELQKLRTELVRISGQSKSGTSELNLQDKVLLVSAVSKPNGDCDLYLTDVTQARQDSSMLNLFFELPFVGMAITSLESKVWVRVNDRLCEILGYPRDELKKLSWPDITHPDDLGADLSNFNKILAGESEGYRMDKRFVRPDKTIIYATIDVRVIRKSSGEIDFFLATIEDITERKYSEKALNLQKNLYAALSASNHAIGRSDSRQEVFHNICQAAVEHAGFLYAWIGELDTESETVKPVSMYGSDDGYVKSVNVSSNQGNPQGDGPAGHAVRTGKHFIVRDVEHDETAVPWKTSLLDRGVKAFASFPIVDSNGVFGVFCVYAQGPEYFSEDAISLLDEMAFDIGFALDNLAQQQSRLESQRSLEASEEKFRSAIQEAPFPILIHAEDGEVLICNKSWLEITGYTLDEMATIAEWTMLAYGESRAVVREEINSLYRLDGRKDEGEFTVRCKNGEIRTWDFSSVALGSLTDGRRMVMSMAADVTERKQSLLQLAEAEEKFRHLVEQSVAGIFMLDERKLLYANPRTAQILGLPEGNFEAVDLEAFIGPNELTAIFEEIRAAISGENSKANLEFDAVQNSGEKIRVGAQGSLAQHEGKAVLLGVMQDISEKHRADVKIAKYVEQLKLAFMSTVDVVMSVGEMRDPYTTGHERGVSKIAVAIATEMGLDEERIEGIGIAGLLHDIGKISIPSELLSKPGRLLPIELQFIQTHAQSSYDILRAVRFPWPVAEIAWEHHERMDGSGYPRGLKGEDILLEARILAVADVVEAMSSHRPYRASLGIDAALEEINKGAGKLYDEHVAAACQRIFKEQGFVISEP